jgi:SAM-dependent methyltransferase
MREAKDVCRPEFDQFAENYSAGFDDPLKTVFGRSPQTFMAPKLSLLERAIKQVRPALLSRPIRALDFGCGTGDFLVGLAKSWPHWILEGCDISAGMLREAKRRLEREHPDIKLWQIEEPALPMSSYDLVTIVCVLHHVVPESLNSVLRVAIGMLKAESLLVIIEHNPLNPVTRWMTSRTEIDRNANLLSAGRLQRHLPLKEFSITEVRNFLFLPPRLKSLYPVEFLLEWLPLGGQYAFFGLKR